MPSSDKNSEVLCEKHFDGKLSRRRFLKEVARFSVFAAGAGAILTSPFCLEGFVRGAEAGLLEGIPSEFLKTAPEARFYISTKQESVSCSACHSPEEKLEGRKVEHGAGVVKCMLCAQECVIMQGGRGKCKARINVDGTLRSLVYGRPVSVHIDPIEKKPFYHYLPGRQAFSMATAGCPLSCQFCQNWEISQAKPEDFKSGFAKPSKIVEAAIENKAPIIAFTYNEPTVFAEYMTDIARLAKEKNVRCVLISCGFMNEAPLAEMCEVLDAIKIDLKGFSRDFYEKVCGAKLEPVLRSLKQVHREGVHLEIVNLVVPTLNDSEKMLAELCQWVAGELGSNVPVHFTRFHPDYKMLNLPPTPLSTLERAYGIAKKTGLNYPYVGNYPRHPGNHTYCPKCGKTVIERVGFFVTAENLKEGRCAYCGEPISGVWI